MKRAPVILVAALSLAACSGDDDAADPSTTPPASVSTTTITAAPTSSVAPTTSATTTSLSTQPSATVTAPSTAATNTSSPTSTVPGETDWRFVVETLGQRRQDLYGSPDVNRIPEVCSPQSQCADQLNVQLGDMASKGWHVEGADPFVVVDARLEDFDGDTLDASVLVTVVAVTLKKENAGQIVDTSGTVIADVEVETAPGHNAQGRFVLGRSGPADNPWRIISQDALPEVPA
jgi:hypothetical protein